MSSPLINLINKHYKQIRLRSSDLRVLVRRRQNAMPQRHNDLLERILEAGFPVSSTCSTIMFFGSLGSTLCCVAMYLLEFVSLFQSLHSILCVGIVLSSSLNLMSFQSIDFGHWIVRINICVLKDVWQCVHMFLYFLIDRMC